MRNSGNMPPNDLNRIMNKKYHKMIINSSLIKAPQYSSSDELSENEGVVKVLIKDTCEKEGEKESDDKSHHSCKAKAEE